MWIYNIDIANAINGDYMQNIFEQIYYKKKCNNESAPLSEEYKRLAHIMIEKEKVFLEKLAENAELKRLFCEYDEAEMQTHSQSIFENYRDAFFTGVRLAMEMFMSEFV